MGNALNSCCATERPNLEKLNGDIQQKSNKKEGGGHDDQGPDEWTDTSMDWTRTDTSIDQSSAGGKKGPSFRTMTKQDYLSLYGIFCFISVLYLLFSLNLTELFVIVRRHPFVAH